MLFFLLWACGSTPKKNDDTYTYFDTSDQNEPEDTVDPEEEDPCRWQENQDAAPLSLVGDQACGGQVYTQSCAICHMEDGSGGNSGKRLLGRIELFDDAMLVDIIVRGQGTMPPIAISSQQTADVIVFLRGHF